MTQDDGSSRRLEEMLAKAFHGNPVMMAITRVADGRYVEVNESFLRATGYERDQVVGRTSVELGIPVDPDVRARLRQALREHQGFQNVEARFATRSGQLRTGLFSAETIFVGFERVILSVVDDVTELRQQGQARERVDARLYDAQRLESLRLLAGRIGNDFNNLLTGILGNANLALTRLGASSPEREHLQQIEGAVLRAVELTEAMLSYAGQGDLSSEPLNLTRLVQAMEPDLEGTASPEIAFIFALAANIPSVAADPARVRRMVSDLVTNASEAMGQAGGTVRVATGWMDADEAYLSDATPAGDLLPGKFVYVEVADSGPGIDERTRVRLFEPFFTTKSARFGLGLAGALGVMRQHGGALKVESAPGRGTTIRVLFPVAKAPPAAAPSLSVQGAVRPAAVVPMPPPAAVPGERLGLPALLPEPLPPAFQTLPAALPDAEAPPPEKWAGSGAFLVVDDEDVVRFVASAMLERLGFTVLAAADGREGVDVFRQHAQDVVAVLLDMTMPVMNGAEALHEMRRIRSDVRVILSSGYDEASTIGRLTEKGLAAFLRKPYRLQALQDKVREVLAR